MLPFIRYYDYGNSAYLKGFVMFDLTKVSKKDIEVVNKWSREYRANCKSAKETTDPNVFEYVCNDCERLVKLMRSRGVSVWQSV